MSGPKAPPISLSPADRQELVTLIRAGAFPFSRSPYERRRVAELKAKQG